MRVFAVAGLSAGEIQLPSGLNSRPTALVSVRNEFDFITEMEMEGREGEARSKFLLRNRLRIPVGWDAIELFPPYCAETWDPTCAAIWAENDLLRAALQRNLRDGQFHALDPNAEARKKMAKLLEDFEAQLNSNEEPVHQFIKSKPEILCPTYCRAWSKLPLGNRVTDFIFREPSGEYLLVELEKPSHLLFRNDGQQREEMTHAIDQIIDWRRYIEDNLSTVQKELGLHAISSNPACLIVIGRSATLDETSKRKLISLQNATPRLRILTYDDLLSSQGLRP